MPLAIVVRDAIDDKAPNPRGHRLAVVSIIFGVISTVLIVARWTTRIILNRSIGSDDYVIAVAGVSVSMGKKRHIVWTELTAVSSSWQLL